MILAAIAGSVGDLGGRHVFRLGVHLITFTIFVVVAHPGHSMRQAFFVASFWNDVQKVVRAEQDIQAAAVTGVGVKDFAGSIFVKDADAGRASSLGNWVMSVVVVH